VQWLIAGLTLGSIVYLVICAMVGWSIAIEKHRSPWEGFIYGLLFGPLGPLIEACLPDRSKASERLPDEVVGGRHLSRAVSK